MLSPEILWEKGREAWFDVHTIKFIWLKHGCGGVRGDRKAVFEAWETGYKRQLIWETVT